MHNKILPLLSLLLAITLLAGCSMPTMDELYCLPQRPPAYGDPDLQLTINDAMKGLEYSAPISGDHQQSVQSADLDGDGQDEYLLFAKDSSEKPLKILIISRVATGYVLMDTIEGSGFAFEFVDYAALDDRPGLEIVVGRQVSDHVVRSVSVYRFASGVSRQLMTGSYSRMLCADLDDNGTEELLLINPGQTDDSNAVAVLYSYMDGEMRRSAELELSAPVSSLRRLSLGKLQNGRRAAFLSCGSVEDTILTDVFVASYDRLYLLEKGICLQALSNYYLYPEDVDGDGVTELPHLVDMKPVPDADGPSNQRLVQWYALGEEGDRPEKLYAYYNYADGWYLRLRQSWAPRLSVSRSDDVLTFYVWNEKETAVQELFSIYVLTGLKQEEQMEKLDLTALYQNESTTYAAKLHTAAEDYDLNGKILKECFSLIRADWNPDDNGDEKE